jgi:thioredoxin reductase (NADPH)
MHLSRYARRVTLLVRAASLAESMSSYLVNEIEATSNVDVRYRVEVVGGGGQGRLEHLDIRDRDTGSSERVSAAAVFVLVGARPRTEWLPAEVIRDRWGYVVTGADLPRQGTGRPVSPFETSLPGVFAVGDVRHGSIKRVASAVGDGSVAIRMVHDHLAADHHDRQDRP